MNYDGLKDDIIRMLSGEHVYVNTLKFQNDMRIVRSRNDVLTVLIHLGYLAYDGNAQECYIPNKEVADEMNNAIKATSWHLLAESIQNSRALLKATIDGNEHAVERAIDQIKRKEYPSKIAEYTGNILLVGINYDKETKQHTCKIEKYCE